MIACDLRPAKSLHNAVSFSLCRSHAKKHNMHRIITPNVSDVTDSQGFKHFTAVWMSLDADSVLTQRQPYKDIWSQ